MSSVYELEPRSRGHVVLRTTRGPLTVSLWADEAPAATRFFLARALAGAYANLPFARVIPGVLAQVGTPAAADAEPRPPRREAHGRLRFRRRGLVALAEGDGGVCAGEVFVTLGKTPWLDGRHSIFGCVEGDTVYNALALESGGEVDLSGDAAARAAADPDTDADAVPCLLSVDVVDNPFADLVVAPVPTAPTADAAAAAAAAAGAAEGGKRAVRNKTLLSFGASGASDDDSGESDGGGGARPPKRARPQGIISSHAALAGGGGTAARAPHGC
jgi:peptidyl-prolyl cis-trans isomerase SDCCAG10